MKKIILSSITLLALCSAVFAHSSKIPCFIGDSQAYYLNDFDNEFDISKVIKTIYDIPKENKENNRLLTF